MKASPVPTEGAICAASLRPEAQALVALASSPL